MNTEEGIWTPMTEKAMTGRFKSKLPSYIKIPSLRVADVDHENGVITLEVMTVKKPNAKMRLWLHKNKYKKEHQND